MILIADGGSTKSNWCLIDKKLDQNIYFNTEGYNPYFIDTASIIESLQNSIPEDLNKMAIDHVYYYGAGCSTQEKNEIVNKAMAFVFPNAEIYIGHDLLAAARALLGKSPGFAAILGTGTNTCLYDGNDITLNIDSLGHYLGDEGSGSYIGKRLLRDYMRKLLPEALHNNFVEEFGLTNEDILDTIYNKPLPNRFLASFAKFVYDNNNLKYCRDIVKEGFNAFFNNLVCNYPDYQKYSFNCIGSVGYNFRDVLQEVAKNNGMAVGKIIRSPIDDLVNYHMNFMD